MASLFHAAGAAMCTQAVYVPFMWISHMVGYLS